MHTVWEWEELLGQRDPHGIGVKWVAQKLILTT